MNKEQKTMLKASLFFIFAISAALGFIVWRNSPADTPSGDEIAAALPNGSQEIFDNADKFVFYSLDPAVWWEGDPEHKYKNQFHRCGVIGQTKITDVKIQQELRAAFYAGIAIKGNTFRAACYEPRHGIRVTKNGRTLDLLICFHCSWTKAFVDGKEFESVVINRKPQDTFNRILTDNGLKLATPGVG